MGNGDAVVIQRHMEFDGGIAYGIDRLLEPPDLGSRCDEFISVELQVSSWGDADVDPRCQKQNPHRVAVGFLSPSTGIDGELRTLWLRAALPCWLSATGKAFTFGIEAACRGLLTTPPHVLAA